MMIVIRSIIFFSLIFSLWKVEINSDFPEVPKSLKGTNWYSQFYHYHNNYYFKTDSTGSSEDGQVALSCPIDTTALGISGDTIIYSNPEKFKYKITDTILRIEYLDWRHLPAEISDQGCFNTTKLKTVLFQFSRRCFG